MRDFRKYRALARNDVNWPPEDRESAGFIVAGVFSVIPARTVIHSANYHDVTVTTEDERAATESGATDVFRPRGTHPCLTLIAYKYHRHCKLARRACRLTLPGTDELRTSVAPSKRRSPLRVWHFQGKTRDWTPD